jgi:hypothetical protein
VQEALVETLSVFPGPVADSQAAIDTTCGTPSVDLLSNKSPLISEGEGAAAALAPETLVASFPADEAAPSVISPTLVRFEIEKDSLLWAANY